MTSLAMLQQQLHLVLIKLASHYTRWQSGHSWCCHLQVKENTFEFQEIQKISNEKEMEMQCGKEMVVTMIDDIQKLSSSN